VEVAANIQAVAKACVYAAHRALDELDASRVVTGAHAVLGDDNGQARGIGGAPDRVLERFRLERIAHLRALDFTGGLDRAAGPHGHSRVVLHSDEVSLELVQEHVLGVAAKPRHRGFPAGLRLPRGHDERQPDARVAVDALDRLHGEPMCRAGDLRRARP
jgi:hypothetical protein